MARPDKREKQLKRARSEIDVALQRGRLAEACDALLMLPEGERTQGANVVAAKLADEHERLLRAGDVGALLKWCARCAREPRLSPAESDELARVRWCWLIAAIRTNDWHRARSVFAQLEPALAGAPLLAELRALVHHEGNPDAELLASFAAESQRLGYDPPTKRGSYPCPMTAQEVEAACLACFAVEPWPRFRAIVQEWAARAPREASLAILNMAVALSRRELVVQATRDPQAALKVAQWCALWCMQTNCHAAMEPVIALCLRSAAQMLVDTVADKGTVERCSPIILVGLGYASLAESVVQVALAPLYALEVAEPAVELLQPLVQCALNARALLRVSAILAMRAAHREEPVELPAWIGPVVERLLQQPADLAAAIGEPQARGAALSLFDALPLALSVRACIALLPVANEPTRELLARAAEELALRMRAQPVAKGAVPALRELRAMLARFDPSMAEEMTDAELRRFLATSEGKALQRQLEKFGRFELASAIPASFRTIFEQVAKPLLPYSVGLLDALLGFCEGKAEERALVDSFWSRRPSVAERFDALLAANRDEYDRALAVLERELLRDLAPQAEDAARALLSAERLAAPRGIRKKLAEALLKAVVATPAAEAAPKVAQALPFARRLVKPRAPRSASKTSPATPKKAAARPRKKATPKRKTELFREESGRP